MSLPSTTVFADPALDEEFRRNGYIVTPLLSPSDIRELLALHDSLTPELAADYYATIFHPDREHRRQVGAAIDAITHPRIAPFLVGYKRAASAFISKRGTTKQGKVPMHQDYTFVDPSKSVGVHIWIPLVDVNEDNGCLSVYPRTHSLVDHISALMNNPSPYHSVRSLLEQKCGVRLPMTAGSAVFFNERTLHGSGENVTSGQRVAVNCAYIPEQETMRLYSYDPQKPGMLDVLSVHSSADLQLIPGHPLPFPYAEGVTHMGVMEYHIEPLTEEQIRPLYNAHALAAEENERETVRKANLALPSPPDSKTVKKAGPFGWLNRGRA